MKSISGSPSHFWAIVSYGFIFINMMSSAYAMGVTPTVIEMMSTGNGSRSTITVNNPGQKPLPVEISIERLELDETSKRTMTPAKADFALFPQTALIPPGQSQVFRIQWAADPQLSQSRTYMFTVAQVPVKMPEVQTGFNILMKFGVLVNVAPNGAVSTLTIKKTAVVNHANKRVLSLLIQNDGNRHAVLSDLLVTLSGGNWTLKLDPTQLQRMIGVGLLQPKKSRLIILPVDVPAAVTQVTARLEYVTR